MDKNNLIVIEDLMACYNMGEDVVMSLINLGVISSDSYGEVGGVLIFDYESIENDLNNYNIESEKSNTDKIKEALDTDSQISSSDLIIFIRDLLSGISLCFFRALCETEEMFKYTREGFQYDLDDLINKAKALAVCSDVEEVSILESKLAYSKKDILRSFNDALYDTEDPAASYLTSPVLSSLFEDLTYFSKQLYPNKIARLASQNMKGIESNILFEVLNFYDGLESDEEHEDFDSYLKGLVIGYQEHSSHKEAVKEMLHNLS